MTLTEIQERIHRDRPSAAYLGRLEMKAMKDAAEAAGWVNANPTCEPDLLRRGREAMSEEPAVYQTERERQACSPSVASAGYVSIAPQRSQSSDVAGDSGSVPLRDCGASSLAWIKDFGPTLKDIREQEGLTQEELAQKAGLTAMHISHFECGRRLPSLPNFRALLMALGDYSACLLDMRDWNRNPSGSENI